MRAKGLLRGIMWEGQLFFVCFVWRVTLDCMQGILLTLLRNHCWQYLGTNGVLGIKLGSVICKTNSLSTILSLWPQLFFSFAYFGVTYSDAQDLLLVLCHGSLLGPYWVLRIKPRLVTQKPSAPPTVALLGPRYNSYTSLFTIVPNKYYYTEIHDGDQSNSTTGRLFDLVWSSMPYGTKHCQK